MKKTLTMLIMLTLLGSSSLVVAADLAGDMGIVADNFRIALKTDSAETFTQSLQKMRIAALNAQQATPEKLAGKAPGSPEIKDYRAGMGVLIGQIDRSLALANQGKLEEARTLAHGFKQTRDTNHKKFR